MSLLLQEAHVGLKGLEPPHLPATMMWTITDFYFMNPLPLETSSGELCGVRHNSFINLGKPHADLALYPKT